MPKLFGSEMGKVSEEIKSFQELADAIIAAARMAHDGPVTYLETVDREKRFVQEMYVAHQHIFFFTHLSRRVNSRTLSSDQIRRLEAYLKSVLPSAAVEVFLADFPTDFKTSMRNNFIDKLNGAEQEYVDSVEKKKRVKS